MVAFLSQLCLQLLQAALRGETIDSQQKSEFDILLWLTGSEEVGKNKQNNLPDSSFNQIFLIKYFKLCFGLPAFVTLNV